MLSLEISVDSLDSALAAQDGGAHRVELCSALREGGLTPSLGLIRAVRTRVQLPLFVLIRPRSGDFVYATEELDIMREDIRIAAKEGADGVVLGVLTAAASVDLEKTRALVEEARPLQVTFHRAFDMTRDLTDSLEEVIHSGADRVLTSGGKSSALNGRAKLHSLVLQAAGRISVLVGGGVRPSNIAELQQSTGAVEFHSSLRRQRASEIQFQTQAIHLGDPEVDQYVRGMVFAEDVRELIHAGTGAVPDQAGR